MQTTFDSTTPQLRSLFGQDVPQAPRCFAVLDGIVRNGNIITDDAQEPSWAIVQEGYDRSLFFGGAVDRAIIAQVVGELRQHGRVLVGLWLDDARWALLPPDPDYDGRALEFYQRPAGAVLDRYLNRLPAGCALVRLDRDLVLRTEWGPEDVRAAGGLERWEQTSLGYCLMRGDEILAEATVGPPALGLYELGVFTQAAHRGRGYGTIVSAGLVREVEALGGQTYWNCAKQNGASAAIARKLGYRIKKEYRCVMWEKYRTE